MTFTECSSYEKQKEDMMKLFKATLDEVGLDLYHFKSCESNDCANMSKSFKNIALDR